VSEPNDAASQLANQFERRRAERLSKIENIDYSDDGVDDILVDIANLCMVYYVSKKMSLIPEGFIPFDKKE